ncbi:TIGR03668 family PPOX class F420-dependent oxidoreductase [Candidatus Entotheonella serta]|nr:TIGR03668 family PPOX class F420-dependent oxidoreductase [Candidatus Entotheonella serta]
MASADEMATILQSFRVGHLATADARAAPHLVPICFVYDGEAVYTAIDHKPKRATGYRMKRIRNMLENPQVTFLVDHYEEDWQQLSYVMVQGKAEVLESGAERQRALELLEDKYPQYRERQLAQDTGLVIKIVPDSIRHWSWAGS